jgi:hypothetical protein
MKVEDKLVLGLLLAGYCTHQQYSLGCIRPNFILGMAVLIEGQANLEQDFALHLAWLQSSVEQLALPDPSLAGFDAGFDNQ